MSYSKDRAWSDLKLPAIRQIVGPLLLEPADFKVDAMEATDLMIIQARDLRIAARVRKAEYAQKYPYEFTIRSSRTSGAKTEMAKIIEGFGDWMFYGFSDDDNGPGIGRWYLIDLAIFRANLIWFNQKKHLAIDRKDNHDNTTSFVSYDIRSFEGKILVASSHEVTFFGETQSA